MNYLIYLSYVSELISITKDPLPRYKIKNFSLTGTTRSSGVAAALNCNTHRNPNYIITSRILEHYCTFYIHLANRYSISYKL